MNDYSDLIFLVAAIAIYGLLVNNTNRTLLMNKGKMTSSEMEYGAVSVAQDVVEEARWMDYGDINKNELENVNDDPNYNVTVDISPESISASERNNRKITIKVTSPYMDDNEAGVTMSYIKTDIPN